MFHDSTDGNIAKFDRLLLYVDGGCEPKNPGGVATSGWALYDPASPEQPLIEEGRVALAGGDLATNNTGEYSSLRFALTFLKERGWRGELDVRADSKLLIEQCKGAWKVNAPHLRKFRDEIWALMDELNLQRVTETFCLAEGGKHACYLTWVPREKNERANALCRLAYQEHVKQLRQKAMQNL